MSLLIIVCLVGVERLKASNIRWGDIILRVSIAIYDNIVEFTDGRKLRSQAYQLLTPQ
ncbi:hypothetical protein CHS0354_013828, partial [Potamilus streckersoni]